MNLIDFDRAGDGVALSVTAGEENENARAGNGKKLGKRGRKREAHRVISDGARHYGPETLGKEMAGYSGTPLPQKLGIKAGQKVATIEAPQGYRELLAPLPAGVSFTTKVAADAPFVHFFVKKRPILEKELERLRGTLADTGILWVSWPKKSSGIPTDITEDVIREVCLPLGFVDVKVCAVDETWSGLKLMIRRANRASP
jgi:hypothetical protein